MLAEPGGTVWIGGSVKNGAKGTTAFAAKWTAGAPAWSLARLGGASPGKWELVDMAADGRGGIWGLAVATNVKGQPDGCGTCPAPPGPEVTPAFGKHEWFLDQLTTVPGHGLGLGGRCPQGLVDPRTALSRSLARRRGDRISKASLSGSASQRQWVHERADSEGS